MEKRKPAPFAERSFAFRRDVWMRNLAKSDLPAGAKLVGIRLALYMNEGKQTAHPSHGALGDDCGLSDRQIRTHLAKLEDDGWITVKHVRNAGNRYWLRYWWSE